MITIYIMSFLISALPALSSIIKKDSITSEEVEYILIMDNGFIDKPRVKRRDYSFQVLIQAADTQRAKDLAYEVYGVLKESYNFELPQPAGTTNDQLYINSLFAIQAPQSLGGIAGRFQYTINYVASAPQTTAQQL